MPKVENELCEFTQTGQLISNMCDIPVPDRIDSDTAAIKIETESNICEDNCDSKSGIKDNEESGEGRNRSNCDTEVGRTRLRGKNIQNNDNYNNGIGSSKPKRTGLKKISYCEASSSAESDLDNEYLPPRKKRTKSSKVPFEKSALKTILSSPVQIPEMPRSTRAVIKQEPSSVDTCKTIKQLLSECSDDENVNLIQDVSAKGGKNKKKVIKKKSKNANIKEISFEEVLKIVKSNHGNKYYNMNRSVFSAFKKYLVYKCRVCTSDFDNLDCAKDHFEKEHSNQSMDEFVDHFNKFYKCNQCGKIVRYLRDLVKHLDSFHNGEQQLYSCDKCAFTSFDKYRFSSHMKGHISPQEKIECHLCHVSVVHIKRHIIQNHSKISTIKCPQCPKTFKSKGEMSKHQNQVHSRKKVSCKVCGKRVKEFNLKLHVLKHYDIDPRFDCQICKKDFKTKKSLDLHNMNSHSSCGEKMTEGTEIPTSSTVSEIKRVPVDTSEPNESVSNCSEDEFKDIKVGGIVTYKAKVLKKRKPRVIAFEEACKILRADSDPNFIIRKCNRYILTACENGCRKYLIYRCRACTRDFDNVESAKDHFETEHTDPKTDSYTDNKNKFDKFYKCDRCAKTLRAQGLRIFIKHLDSCHNGKLEQLYSCDKCVFTTFHKYRFTSHLKSHIRPKNKIKEKTECHFCHLSFTNIKMHLKNMHSESKLKCPLCPKTCGSQKLLKAHRVRVHAEATKIVCKQCGVVCKSERGFKNHIQTHYKTERFECPLCKIALKSKHFFNLHMTRLHGGVGSKLLKCTYCNKCFVKNVTLQNHIRKEHDGNNGPKKNHLCETCGKSFILKQTLDRHVVVHTKEKKFVCATCNKAFTQMDSLKTHQVVHTGIKPFECGKCGNKYSQKYPLTLHIKKHHSD